MSEKWRHPLVTLAERQLMAGKTDRRDFLRTVTLLGVSAPVAYGLAGRILGKDFFPPAAAQGTPVQGGILRCSMPVGEINDPALHSWNEPSNCTRHIVEYLTYTGPDNVTRPYLAESWEVSDDLTTWTFKLRPNVTWHNGDAFTTEDVEFNFRRWLDPATGSSNIGLFAAMTETVETGETDDDGNPVTTVRMIDGAFERVDDLTFRLHLATPVLSIPENMYNYPAAIVHRDFDGNFPANPNGTGPYTLAEFEVASRCILRRAERPYWGENWDDVYFGGPIYLDEIHYYDHGNVSAAQLAAFASNQVDMTYEVGKDSLPVAESIPNSGVYAARTAQTGVMRMKVTEKPFDDIKVRRAVMLACDAPRFREVLYGGQGDIGNHFHVAPIHPEYYPLPELQQDIEAAKALLAEAGYPDGIDLTIDCGNTSGPWHQQACELLREQVAEAGIRLTINVIPAAQYWEIWDKTPFGITQWTHRPLGTMVLSLGYRSGVPWNESGFASAEFDEALNKAEALVDVDARREAMADVQRIMQEQAVVVLPLWLPVFFAASNKVKGLNAHPTQYHQFQRVWIDA